MVIKMKFKIGDLVRVRPDRRLFLPAISETAFFEVEDVKANPTGGSVLYLKTENIRFSSDAANFQKQEAVQLDGYLAALKSATKMFGLCVQWSETGIEIHKVDAGDGNPDYLVYSCITQDGGFDDPTLVAKDLIYDD
jgi:hypothetical protein